jgi:hypothetical protein
MMTDIEYSMYAVCMISVILAEESFSEAVYTGGKREEVGEEE